MAVAFSQFSWWSWSGKHQDAKIRNGSSKNSSTTTDVNKLEFENVKFPLVNVAPSTSKRVKWHSQKEREVDKDYDVVLVPSDGGCLSGSESDDSDWSIGWLEPHGAGFCSDDDDDFSDDSFAVLVPCYGRGRNDIVNAKKAPNDKFLSTIGQVPDIYSAENEVYMEQWLSSLQHN